MKRYSTYDLKVWFNGLLAQGITKFTFRELLEQGLAEKTHTKALTKAHESGLIKPCGEKILIRNNFKNRVKEWEIQAHAVTEGGKWLEKHTP